GSSGSSASCRGSGGASRLRRGRRACGIRPTSARTASPLRKAGPRPRSTASARSEGRRGGASIHGRSCVSWAHTHGHDPVSEQAFSEQGGTTMTRKTTGALFTATALLIAGQALAQGNKPPEMTPEQKAEMEAMMKAGTPGAPHEHMKSTVGAYDAKVKMWHEPGKPAEETTATVTRSMTLGDRVLVEEFAAMMMGMPYKGHGMFGYDNVTGKYWSTWNDNMSTGIMMSKGTCKPDHSCTFSGTSNDPVTKKSVNIRM